MNQKKKVLLVNTNTEKAPYPISPVGLCYVASSIVPDFAVQVYDGTYGSGQGLEKALRAFHPDFIGVNIRNIDNVVMDDCHYYLQEILHGFIKPIRSASAAPVILGGSGFSLFPEQIMSLFDVDYGVVGEGELSFPLLLKALTNNEIPQGIPGVIFRTSVLTVISLDVMMAPPS